MESVGNFCCKSDPYIDPSGKPLDSNTNINGISTIAGIKDDFYNGTLDPAFMPYEWTYSNLTKGIKLYFNDKVNGWFTCYYGFYDVIVREGNVQEDFTKPIVSINTYFFDK